MTSQHLSDMETGTVDSVNSSPRSDYTPRRSHRSQEDSQPRVRFMCSFGGQILPRPHDNQLRYVGGDTRIVAVPRFTTYSSLLSKLSKLSGSSDDITVKYQLPNEDLDSLISVTSDEDIENMMEEYDRLIQNGNQKTARLRLFLFPANLSRTSSIGTLLGGSARREHWFFDALNGGGSGGSPLERNRSEVSSILSEVPDYLFGLDNPDYSRDPKPKPRTNLAENVSISDPGSPAPVITPSPYGSTSSAVGVSSIPDLPPVKTRPETPTPAVDWKSETGEQFVAQQTGYANKPMWHYVPETHHANPPMQPVPVYYYPGTVPGSTIPVQVQQVPVSAPYMQPVSAPYVQRFPVPAGQVPVVYRQPVQGVGQIYGGVRPDAGYEYQTGVIPDGLAQQQVYYGGRNVGVVPTGYQATTVAPGGTEMQVSATEMKITRVPQQH